MATGVLEHVERRWPAWFGTDPPAGLHGVILSRGAVVPARATMFVFARSERRPRLAMKVAFEPEHSEFLEHEFRSLQQVRTAVDGALRSSIPVPHALDHVDGVVLEVMEAVGGTQPALPSLGRRRPVGATRSVRRFLSRLLDWSDALAASTAAAPRAGEHELGEVIRRFCVTFAVPDPGRSRLRAFAEAVERTQITWSPCWQHGDLTVGNVLFEGTRPRVLDWELARSDSPPWFDAAYVWLALALLHHHRIGGASVVEVLPSLWEAGTWLDRLGRDVLASRWAHPLPLPWALLLVAIAAALRAVADGRTGAPRWAALATAMIDDETRRVIPQWVPRW